MNSPKNGEGELDLVHLAMNGKLPWEKETFKGLSRVPNQLHEPGESFPASFLIFHSLSPASSLVPCPCTPLALSTLALPQALALEYSFSAREGKRCWLRLK